MFKMIHQMLQLDDFYGVDKKIDFMKGVEKYPSNFKEAFRYAIRKIMSNNDKEAS